MKKLFYLTFLSISLVIMSFTLLKSKEVKSLKEMKKMMKKGYSFIPSGKTLVGKDTVSVQGFFMLKNEISNFEYLEYLYFLKNNNRLEEYNKALPDTSLWKTKNAGEAFEKYYFRHPAYRDFPVVNISREQAEAFCVWLTEVWRKNTGNNSLILRLPQRAEYLRAANGLSLQRAYAWNGPYLKNEKGQQNCNYLSLGDGVITRDSGTGELTLVQPVYKGIQGYANGFTDILAPKNGYLPNEFGIYHLNGNAAEMVAEKDIVVGGDWRSPGYDVRNESTQKYNGASPTVGFRPVMTFLPK